MNDDKPVLPLVSVAMCTYNGARFISAQLESILSQSYKNLEIIIVDDASSDGSFELLQAYSDRDSRITLLRNDSNLGFVKNFAKAIGQCRGDYIALADQDDIWLPQKIERLLAEIGDNWLIYSKVTVIDENGAPVDAVFPKVRRLQGRCPLSLILNNCVTGHACLLNRAILPLAMPLIASMPYHDQWLAIVAAARGKLVAGDEVLSCYRRHSSNAVMGKKTRRAQSKAEKSAEKLAAQLAFIDAVLASGVLSEPDRKMLVALREHLSRNACVLYNFALRRFLRTQGQVFLRLYTKPAVAARKLARGIGYFRLNPFA